MRIVIELPDVLENYVNDLMQTGLYGRTHEEAVLGLVRGGIISAVSTKMISVRHDGMSPAPKREAHPMSLPDDDEDNASATAPLEIAEASTLQALTPTQARALKAVQQLLAKADRFTTKELSALGGTSAPTNLQTLARKGYIKNIAVQGLPVWKITFKGEPKVEQWIAGSQNTKRPGAAPKRRFTEHKELKPETVSGLPSNHPAIIDARTLFPSTVIEPSESPRLLVSGQHSRKLGSHVTKGPWIGFPIFQLTLEERATCPSTCAHWTSCYGNGMPQSRRHAHGPDLIDFLRGELTDLQEEHPKGFVVRLHVLGDFWSVDYVAAWFGFIRQFPALHVFGYTAWPRSSEIGAAVKRITDIHWDRFAIRFSDAEPKPQGATTIWRQPEGDKVPEGLVCPAQTGKTDCCGSCGLCWSETMRDRTIVFVAHGPKFNGSKPDLTSSDAGLRRIGEIQPTLIVSDKPVPRHLQASEIVSAPVTHKTIIRSIQAAPDITFRAQLGNYFRDRGIAVSVLGKGRFDACGREVDFGGLVALANELRSTDGLEPFNLEADN